MTDLLPPRPAVLTPADVARKLGLPHLPTAEQEAVIGAPLRPSVVVAGAGSGKTETMAARVVWLVANGLVRPEQVLGLTFTRKAAGELAHRIRRRLRQLAAANRAAVGEAVFDGTLLDGEPMVATYDAYAGRIVAEHALRIGVEPSARVVGEAVRWQLAHRVVSRYDGPMDEVDAVPSTVVRDLLGLAGDLSNHLVDQAELIAFTTELDARIRALPRRKGQRTKADMFAEVTKMLARQSARLQLLPMLEAYEAEKRTAEVMEFGDQMRYAATIAERFPEVGTLERHRFEVVLLDEYQDTSTSQARLLRSLFAGHPVTAVGDPCQSIYGWRGASQGTLRQFRERFLGADGRPADTASLRTSFRNSTRILTIANHLSWPLRAEGIDVEELTAASQAPAGTVLCALHPTVEEEYADVVERIAALWQENSDRAAAATAPGEEPVAPRTIAVLTRLRAPLEPLSSALRARGIPVEVAGLSGLLGVPEVVDIVSTLRVLADPTAGDALMRLLTGARWRIGPRDIEALGRWAGALAKATPEGVEIPKPTAPATQTALAVPADAAENDDVEERSIIDALDLVETAPEGWFSRVGRRRLSHLAAELRNLRSRVGQPLPDLVSDVERTVRLDVEVAARDGIDPVSARAQLDRLVDVAAEFAKGSDVSTLGGFLEFLAAAETAERGLDLGEVEVREDRVQLVTVHAAKGLEWDAVFVPGLVPGRFPSQRAAAPGTWTTDREMLPYPLRGDAAFLPALELRGVEDQAGVEEARVAFRAACGERELLEERRLAYVAVTRAREILYCSGYWWDERTKPQGPSDFLTEIRQACVDGAGEITVWSAPPAEDTPNPLTAEPVSAVWPHDPLGARRERVEAAAAEVRSAREAVAAGAAGEGSQLSFTLFAEPAAPVAPEVPDNAPSFTLSPDPDDPGPAEPDVDEPDYDEPYDEAGIDEPGIDEPGIDEPGPAEPAPGWPDGDLPDPVATPDPQSNPPSDGDDGLSAEERELLRSWERDVPVLIAERRRRAPRSQLEIAMPAHLSVSELVTLHRDRNELARRIRRPMPFKPAPAARRGTAFHSWLEQRFGAGGLLDVDQMPGSGDGDVAPDSELALLQEAFEASRWADRVPVDVEVPFDLRLGGIPVRGRMDAVFRDPDGGYDVVDWKTGQPPAERDRESVSVQLAAYRLAWAELSGAPVESVRAAFHYVKHNLTERPADLLDAAGLARLLESIPRI